jgi:hypothetical protein
MRSSLRATKKLKLQLLTATTTLAFIILSQFIFAMGAYAFTDGIWAPVNGSDQNFDGQQLIKLSNGDVFSINDTQPTTSTSIYKHKTNTWINGPTLSGVAIQSEVLEPLPHRQALIIGGDETDTNTTPNSVYLFNEKTMTITPVNPLNTCRFDSAGVVLPDSQVMVIGGQNCVNESYVTYPGNTAEIYDPTTGNWTLTGTIPFFANQYGAVVLANGQVMISGFAPGSASTIYTAIYNPSTNTWTQTASLKNNVNIGNGYDGLVLLPNNDVMAIEGYNYTTENFPHTTEIWDPSTGIWTPGASIPGTGQIFGAAQMADGDVMITTGSGGDNLESTYVYSNNTDQWQQVAPLLTGSSWQGVSLKSGDLLAVTNGNPGGSTTTDSFLFEENSVGSQNTTPPQITGMSWSESPAPSNKSITLTVSVDSAADPSGVLAGDYYTSEAGDRGTGINPLIPWNGSNLVLTIPANTWRPGTYHVYVSAVDGAGNWSAPSEIDLIIYDNDSKVKVSGTNGVFTPAGNTSNQGDVLPFPADPNTQADFNFDLHYKSDGTLPGNFNLAFTQDSNNYMNLSNQSYSWLVAQSATNAEFSGIANVTISISGQITTVAMPYLVNVFDGSYTNQADHFELQLFQPGQDVITDTPTYQLSGDLQSGSIDITGIP